MLNPTLNREGLGLIKTNEASLNRRGFFTPPYTLASLLGKEVIKVSEKDNEELEKLKHALATDLEHQRRKEAQTEAIRQKMESIAKAAAAKYHREVDLALPEARGAVERVVQPWFSGLISSGVYEQLSGWSASHEKDVRLSDTIIYYWPKDALKELAKESERPYLRSAEFVVEHYQGAALQRRVQIHAGSDEVWYAGFKLEDYRWSRKKGVSVWRRPVVGMGWGFAIVSSTYLISVDPQNISASLPLISPEVWIKFGQQIESGEAWQVINRSMKDKKVEIATPGETQRNREEDKRAAGEYLKNRQWH